jgi:hypothetical protein
MGRSASAGGSLSASRGEDGVIAGRVVGLIESGGSRPHTVCDTECCSAWMPLGSHRYRSLDTDTLIRWIAHCRC